MYPDRVEEALRLPGDEAAALLSSFPESQWFDRKSARIRPHDLATPLVAMANADGGYIAVGLSGGQVEPLPERRLGALQQAGVDFTSPPVRTSAHALPVAGGLVAVIRVEPGATVHETTSGQAYLRVGDESRKLTFAQRRELEYDRGTEVYSAAVVAGSTTADLDPAAAEAYRLAIGAASVESMLRARDLVDPEGRLRVAAWLMFGRAPGRGHPNAHVRVLKYGATERGTGSALSLLAGHDARCEGTIPEQIDRASVLIDEWIPGRRALAASGRFEDQAMLPRRAWLEGLVNAVVHRSYSDQGDHVRVEIFPNRVEISSPGRFPSFADPADPASIICYARNPRIARACAELGYGQELGGRPTGAALPSVVVDNAASGARRGVEGGRPPSVSGQGIRRMFECMRQRGLASPVYAQTSSHVILTLLATPAGDVTGLPRGAVTVLDVMRHAGRPLRTGEVAEAAAVQRPTAIRHLAALRSAGLVVWRGDSPRDPSATWSLV